ncbi:acyl-[ACP]--phospholipid O-acyltransferase [Verrucomicrobiota bacterium sgz303538]
MKTDATLLPGQEAETGNTTPPVLPLWLKALYTAFMAILVPVYWANYGPTNFLYFCDIALFLTLYGLWKESRFATSMAAVGILVPQLFWCLDFGTQLVRLVSGSAHSGMTAYMFDGDRPLFLRGLSLFHGWLPFLLVFMVSRLGYERRALKAWTGLAWVLCLVAYFWLPPAGATLADPKLPVNVNYVFGFDDAHPQQWMPSGAYLLVWMSALLGLAYVPTHLVLKRLFGRGDSPLTPSRSSEPVITEDKSWKRSFWSLFAVQFQGAFSDNVFKFLVIFVVSRSVSEAVRDQYISIVLATFSLPFILFSMTGGFLADRFPKRAVVIGTKILEIAIMALGTVGLVTLHLPTLLGVVFLMSLHSALFSPSKYSLLPEMLPESRLSWGNGIIGLGTFMAIITGGLTAGILADNLPVEKVWIVGAGLVALAVAGLWCSKGITHRAAANPDKQFRLNFLSEIWSNVRLIRRDRVLFLSVAGIVYFWFLGALFGEPTLLVYSQDILKLDATHIGMLRACLAVGIGIGSAVAGVLSGKKIEYGLVPLGSLGLSVSLGLMALPGLSAVQFGLLLALLGFSGGFYTVPLNALIQHRPDAKDKGSIIAAESWLTSVGIFAASGVFWVLKTLLGLAPTTIFLLGSVATLVATVAALRLVPDSLLRLLLWIVTHTLYRLRIVGRNRIPEEGGALVVCNHTSLADACLLIASTDRHIRFLIDRSMYEKWWIRPFARMLQAIPISSKSRPKELIQALQTSSEWIKAGNVVCIFAEGEITRTGQMLPFRNGLSRIMKSVEAPIVPVHIDNAWGSIFSFEGGRFYSKLPRRIPYPITVSYGESLPPDTDPVHVRQAVQELGTDAWAYRKSRMTTVHRSFVRTARRHPFRMAMTDANSPRRNFFTALVQTLFLARRLKPVWENEEKVGILLPPSVPGALVNYAAMLMGKIPVNLNYTLSEEALASCIRQCNIRKVVSSGKFLSHLNLRLPVETVLLEEITTRPRLWEKISTFLMACFYPVSALEKALGARTPARMDDLATVIFSSGSTGEPKGVMLSHYNVASNVEQIRQVLAFRPDDRLLGILPFFHSFGFTGVLGASALLGVGVAYHANPTEAKTIGELVQEHHVTFLLSTPTFLQLYMRGCTPAQFGSVRFAMVGAEKLPERLASAFEERFGLRPMEAYGCTECAPAVTVNTGDFRATGFRQVGAKRGTIGHPLPGVTVRIVDIETGELQPTGASGMMLVRGPNVMQGYLGQPEKTEAVLQDGWYSTGDIAAVDEDGFVTITDRLSRFSKIGGEMVPHIKIEETLQELAGETEQVFAVTGVPDASKGERLMVLCRLGREKLTHVLEKLASSELPNLWKPRKDQFIQVEQIPLLGTGKTDLRKVREIAARIAQRNQLATA